MADEYISRKDAMEYLFRAINADPDGNCPDCIHDEHECQYDRCWTLWTSARKSSIWGMFLPPMLPRYGMDGGQESTTNQSDTTTFVLRAGGKMTWPLTTAPTAGQRWMEYIMEVEGEADEEV